MMLLRMVKYAAKGVAHQSGSGFEISANIASRPGAKFQLLNEDSYFVCSNRGHLGAPSRIISVIGALPKRSS